MQPTAQPDNQAAADAPLAVAWTIALLSRWRTCGMLGLSEARLAALGLAAMVFFAAAAAMLGFTAWLMLNGLAVAAMLRFDVQPILTISIVATLNAAAAYATWSRALYLTRYLEFPETRRLLDTMRPEQREREQCP